MAKYLVEYVNEAGARHHAQVEAASEMHIPFRLRDQGVRDLERVLSATPITDKPSQIVKRVDEAPVSDVLPEPKAEPKPETKPEVPAALLPDPYKPSEGQIFAKHGKIGKKYVAANCVAFEIIRVTELSVRVKIGNKYDYIAPHTECVPFDLEKHAHLVKRKVEEEEEK